MELDLSFLKTVEVTAVDPKQAATRVAVSKSPVNSDLRVYPNGSIYPSKQFVEDHELEYQAKGSKLPGFGIDVFKSSDWANVNLGDKQLLFAAISPKGAAKVDLFSKCSYNEDGTPKSSVLTQGKNAFVAQLIEMIAEVYKVEFSGVEYVELKLATEHQMTVANGIYALPTKVARGVNKGQLDFKKRVNVEIFPLVISHVEHSAKAKEQARATEEAPIQGSLMDRIIQQEQAEVEKTPSTLEEPEAIAAFDDRVTNQEQEPGTMPESPFSLG